ncbi:ABC transporter ATP-binding protein [Sphingobacteriaceae bacterium]|nr:ABC transporter ATP-binding protein [Sphingobacteriaceae bacterium]
MSNEVIIADNISKLYKLGVVGMGTLSDDVKRLVARMKGKEDPTLKLGVENKRDSNESSASDYVWALKDINFSVNKGEVLGIIGKNGAGKSTLLKILSKVTEPSTGVLKYKGRLASLLEVGTGFHPDLTGIENIYLNGAILGMKRHEIKQQLDAIIDFSGVSKYINTPVKRYSSGMYVRLAFAVAAHLETDILVIDEVLAVGDQEFQEKCLGKMKDVAGHGRTVLFVSHNMASMKALCTKGILMQRGTIQYQGSMQDTVQQYMVGLRHSSASDINLAEYRTIGSGIVKFSKVILDNKAAGSNRIFFKESIKVNLEIECKETIDKALLDCRIITADGIEIIHSMNQYNDQFHKVEEGTSILSLELQNDLQPGNYYLTFGIHRADGFTLEYVENCLPIEVLSIPADDSKGHVYDFKLGYVRANSKWNLKKIK